MKKLYQVLFIFTILFQSCNEDNLLESSNIDESNSKKIKVNKNIFYDGNSCSSEVFLKNNFNRYRYDSNHLITSTNINNPIKVYSELVDDTFASWTVVLQDALESWNNSETCIRLELTTNKNEADIRIYDGDLVFQNFLNFEYPGGAYWGVEYSADRFTDYSIPIAEVIRNYFQGDYHSIIFIDTDHTFSPSETPTQMDRIALLVHEIGHSLGFLHESRTSYPSIPDINLFPNQSMMSQNIADNIYQNSTSELTDYDELAINYLYDCVTGIINNPFPAAISIQLNDFGTICPETLSISGVINNLPQTAGQTGLSLFLTDMGGMSGQISAQIPIEVASTMTNGSNFNFGTVNLYDVIPNFNSNNNYQLHVDITSIDPTISSSSSNIIFENNCDGSTNPMDPSTPSGFIDHCDLSDPISYQYNGFNSYTFRVTEEIMNRPNAHLYSFEWHIGLFGGGYIVNNLNTDSVIVNLPPSANQYQVYLVIIYNNNLDCREKTSINILHNP